MKKAMKCIMAGMLSVLMVLSSVPQMTFAAASEQPTAEVAENVEYVQGKVIFSVREKVPYGSKCNYLTASSELCKECGLTEVMLVMSRKVKELSDDAYTVFDTYYEATIEGEVWDAIELLRSYDEVSSAEPDYIWEKTEEGMPEEATGDEFWGEWYFSELGLNTEWGYNVTGKNVVVAVIDTGVDYTHSDLADSMWINSLEIPDNGVDDDENGYIDDIYGINLIDNSGNPMDDNGHGTHVAGIIAMQQNGIGGVGIACDSKIMAIKAGQANGSFASSDIAKAVMYAAINGADVINMSFGGTGKSTLVEAALEDAFSSCVLVASAGNESATTTDALGNMKKMDIYPAGYEYVIGVMASDEGNQLASFSNWDYQSGANCEYEIIAPGVEIYSTLPGNRYARWSGTSMAAPMVSAIAALIRAENPNKAVYTSRYIMGQLTSATEDIVEYVDRNGMAHVFPKLNFSDSMNNTPSPNLKFKEVYIFDTESISEKNNGNGIVQAGETIDIGFKVWNAWGVASDVSVSVSTESVGGVSNPYVEVLSGEVELGDIGTFASENNEWVYEDEMLVGTSNPIRLKISEDTPNDVQITVTLDVSATNGMDETDGNVYTARTRYTFLVQRGKTLSGVISEDMILTSDEYWIIENNVLIPEGVTVTVEPGTQIQFWSADPSNAYGEEAIVYIKVEGSFIAEGTEEEPIEMFPGKGYENYSVSICTGNKNPIDCGFTKLKYVVITNPGALSSWTSMQCIRVNEIDHCRFIQNTDVVYGRFSSDGDVVTACYHGSSIYANSISNSYFVGLKSNIIYGNAVDFEANYVDTCRFEKCLDIYFQPIGCSSGEVSRGTSSISNSLFLHNTDYNGRAMKGMLYSGSELHSSAVLNNLNVTDSSRWFKFATDAGSDVIDASQNYWGTDNETLVKLQVRDADYDVSLGDLVQEPFLTLESEEMENIYPFVTDIYLTDEDGNEITEVSGNQEVTFHVLFNRDMSQEIQPMVSYGPGEPYTDYAIHGDWVGDREWAGTVVIEPFINLGEMYLRVKDAAAADDEWLLTGTDAGRFMFEVSSSAIKSMTLQGAGGPGVNELSWMQDDFDTLAGYRLYRSTSYDTGVAVEEQGFSLLTNSLIAGDVTEYVDEEVEQGTSYYYYFTVMDTEFNESQPSNVVKCTPKDGEPPVVVHTPIESAEPGQAVLIKADIMDNVQVESVTLYYKMEDAEDWQSVAMRNMSGTSYRATISSYEVVEGTFQYYIVATDGVNTTENGSEQSPHCFIAATVEKEGVEEFVSRLYSVILGRDADEDGLTEWTGYLENGVYTGAEVAKGFIMSDEFLNKEMSNEAFVQIMYSAFFGREADDAGLTTWVDFLDQGYRKSFIFAGFANSDEFGALCEGYGVEAGSVPVTISEQQPGLSEEEYNIWLFVERLYTEVLNRTPDMLGIQEWADYLQNGTFTGAEVSEGFIMSEEFQNKDMSNEEYVQILYKAFFGREADPSGLETWVTALETQFTKAYVFAGFANSTEFGTLCESYGIARGEVQVPEQ